MRTTADVTMVPPKPATPTNDSSTAVPPPAPGGAFQKKLEGAQQKQKPAATKGAAGKTEDEKKPAAKEADATAADLKAAEADETATADVEVAQTEVEQTVSKGKVVEKQTVAPKSTGNTKTSKTKRPQLPVTKLTAAKPKAAAPKDAKEETDTNDATAKTTDVVNPAVVQTATNVQVQPPTDPVDHDVQTDTDSDDLTAKVVVPAKTASNKPAAAKAPAPVGGDDNTADFDDAVEAAQDVLGPDDNAPPVSHSTGMNAAPAAIMATPLQTGTTTAAKVQSPAPVTPEAQFVSTNHPSIVTGIHGKLLPNGGTMTLRLDPPELGALQVSVHMRDGVMTAAFETSNDQATRLVSHSLSQLKSALESAGMSVEKLHVQQSPRQESGDSSDRQSSQRDDQQQEARQEQQRRQMLNRMWRKLAGGEDPLDLVA